MAFFKKFWPWNEVERFVVLGLLQGEVNFFIREFLEVFYFPIDFIVVAENFSKGFLKSFSSK